MIFIRTVGEREGVGLGKEMMLQLIQWAGSNSITKKFSLVIREDNTVAIKLYEKLEFKEEGLLIKDNCINNVYYSSLIMALFI